MMEPASRAREAFSWSFPSRVSWQGQKPSLSCDPPQPRGPEAEIEILTQFIGPEAKLDLYEARDLARRRTAMREFDALQAVKAKNPA
jgi:hypothetical protein